MRDATALAIEATSCIGDPEAAARAAARTGKPRPIAIDLLSTTSTGTEAVSAARRAASAVPDKSPER
ncbi:hypothetical protein GCM10018965_095260 [Nonomuraea roseola]